MLIYFDIVISNMQNICMLQEEESTQGVQDKNDSSEVGWEDSEFQSLEDVQPLEQPSISELISKHIYIYINFVSLLKKNLFLCRRS